jgi:hypothetical protein
VNTKEIRQVIERLALGVDPYTGVKLPNEHLMHRPEVTRALFVCVRVLDLVESDELSSHQSQDKPKPPKAGSPWSREEDERLIEEYNNRNSLAEIAEVHDRTRGAISARLVRLGIL